MRRAEVVICGAGIAGVATAYFLTSVHGVRDVVLVDEGPPLSLTSDKSTECYRNWWPGPGDAMVQLMNRSIDILESLAVESKNIFHLNRRGYLYTTADPARVEDLRGFAAEASSLGAGEVRVHSQEFGSHYMPHQPEGFSEGLEGADLITDPALIREHFPYLAKETAGALHVRQAGWLSAQQLGMMMLNQARENGAVLVEDRVAAVEIETGEVAGVVLGSGERIVTETFVNAAGPFLSEVAEMVGYSLPVMHEVHLKASIADTARVVDRDAPLLIDTDSQRLDWTEDERAALAEEGWGWLLEELPSGAHVRPEGGAQADTIIMLWDARTHLSQPVLPVPLDPLYPEVAVRGLCKMLPGMKAYRKSMPKPYLDGGYYTRTEENRPLCSPMPVAGSYVIGAMSGFGIMSAPSLGELLAGHICGSIMPAYAWQFELSRYEDPTYQEMLADWGDSWQL